MSLSHGESYLANMIGRAIRTEKSAAAFGEAVEPDIRGNMDGDDLLLDLPDRAENQAHIQQYQELARKVPIDWTEWEPEQPVYDGLVEFVKGIGNPERRVEAAALAAYGIEQDAWAVADKVETGIETAGMTGSLNTVRDIKGEERLEYIEFRETLQNHFGYTDEELERVSGADDVIENTELVYR